MSLVQQVETVLVDEVGLRPGIPLIAAVSGGLDSMVLLHVLTHLVRKHRWHLTVAHFNHRLRGRASHADALFVQRAARQLGFDCQCESANVKQLAQREKLSLEMAARKARHDFLVRVAQQAGARHILLAHHAQDQVELFFIRLLQGAGPTGLKGMEKISPAPANEAYLLVRPFLNISRQGLEEYAKEHGVKHREDQSNASLEPLRNRIRHQLLPLLTSWQPGLPQVILRTMELLRAEDAFVTEQLALRQRHHKDVPAQWPLALQRRHLAAELIRMGIQPNFEWIEFLRQHAGQPITVADGQRVQTDTHLNLVKLPPLPSLDHVEAGIPLQLTPAGDLQWQGRKITWQHRRSHTGRRPSPCRGVEWFDAHAVGTKIVLRHWQPGDRFWPIGAPAEMKLQDFFVNQKVPAAERRRRLVAETSDGRIFWVEGLRIAEPFKVRPQTRLLLRWECLPAK